MGPLWYAAPFTWPLKDPYFLWKFPFLHLFLTVYGRVIRQVEVGRVNQSARG
jgi:hypothetical protein